MIENRTDFLRLLDRQKEILARLEEMVSEMAGQLEEMDERQSRLIKKLEGAAKDLRFLAADSSFFADDFKDGYHEWEMNYLRSRNQIFYIGISGVSSAWSI